MEVESEIWKRKYKAAFTQRYPLCIDKEKPTRNGISLKLLRRKKISDHPKFDKLFLKLYNHSQQWNFNNSVLLSNFWSWKGVSHILGLLLFSKL